MAIVPFDTLKLAKGLESGGFTATQASAAVEALANAASTADLATKADLQAAVDRLDHKIELSAQKTVIRFGGMLVVAVGVMIAALRYFVH